ncbi:uncharacterized protein EI90DRAFT_3151936, partial [Cantharellus anzutake]|uniref:uncharacterized protein n=1 Tax=Cantharellus anzutake TaxID=1750568 RepID=UPI0019042AF6
MSLAILSRENSTGISLTSSGSTRSGTSIRKMALSSHEENGQIPDSSEESTLEQSHKPARRYPATLSSTPLPPHRLAKIASSFGVHVPIPHSAPETTFGTRRSYSSSSYSRHHHRTTTATRLLLHVIPPETLPPSESRCLSGIRANARRGSLLPLHTTLKGQLEAIKREYNFPSIAGLVVYLLDIQDEDSTTTGFIGPKISEEAWKLLWYRALAMDRTDTKRAFLSPPPLPSTSPPSPMSAEDASETDSQSHEPATTDPFKSAAQRKLRSLHTAQGIRTSPSTTTLSSTNSNESHTFCLPHHPGMSQRSLSLNSDSSSITSARTLPSSTVVGKIEFDIDLDKGRWYEQWARRKSGGATSAPPTNRSLLSPAIVAQKEQERQQFRRGPLDVPTTPITPITPITLNDDVGDATYTQLADSNDGAGDDDGIGTADTTARAEDPETVLELRDEDVWRELHASDSLLTKSKANPHTQFNAMLEGTIPESDPIGVYSATRDLEEVLAKWNERRSTMGTTSATASPPPLDSPIVLRGEEVKSSSVIFPRPKPRSIPPPLPLDNDDKPSVEVSHASPTSTSPSFNLLEGAPFTNGVLSEEANENDSGSEYSNNSQVLFRQQLDRIEQHLAQVSPRKLPDGVTMPIAEAISPGPSPRELLEMVQNSPRSPLPGTPGFLSKGFSRPTPGQPLISTAASSPIVKRRPSGNTQWPAVPFEHVANEMRLNRTEPPVSPSFSS